jgi:starch synthase
MDNRKLNILYTAAEADPLIKVGGLADVAYALPQALRSLEPGLLNGYSLDVRLFLPYYSSIKNNGLSIEFVTEFEVPHPHQKFKTQAYLTSVKNLPIYLITGDPVLLNAPVYSSDDLLDGFKFTFFSLAIFELVKKLGWKPDILHANDWHTATAVHVLKKSLKLDPFFEDCRSIITVHNLPFMGAGASQALSDFGIPPAQYDGLPDWARYQPLPMGLAAADQIVAVSPTYAAEILTPEYGCGLQDFLNIRQANVSGIVNGIDVSLWDPETDPDIPVNFNTRYIDDRLANKKRLLSDLLLPHDLETPLFIMIGRIDYQKGIDLALSAFREIKDLPWNIIILGKGNPDLENEVRKFESDFPERVRAFIRFDSKLSHQMYAGSDMLVMPSRYEPCGLAQMIAMRYGCIPIARATGGLKDTIVDIRQDTDGTGFLFHSISHKELANTLLQANDTFKNNTRWASLIHRAMECDFSWNRSALSYAKLYTQLKEGLI